MCACKVHTACAIGCRLPSVLFVRNDGDWGKRQQLLCKSLATADSFPGISVIPCQKERRDELAVAVIHNLLVMPLVIASHAVCFGFSVQDPHIECHSEHAGADSGRLHRRSARRGGGPQGRSSGCTGPGTQEHRKKGGAKRNLDPNFTNPEDLNPVLVGGKSVGHP